MQISLKAVNFPFYCFFSCSDNDYFVLILLYKLYYVIFSSIFTAWVSAVVAVFIISIGSLSGILLAPFSEEKSFTVVLTFLISVAVATLLGDAILHLFPHVCYHSDLYLIHSDQAYSQYTH